MILNFIHKYATTTTCSSPTNKPLISNILIPLLLFLLLHGTSINKTTTYAFSLSTTEPVTVLPRLHQYGRNNKRDFLKKVSPPVRLEAARRSSSRIRISEGKAKTALYAASLSSSTSLITTFMSKCHNDSTFVLTAILWLSAFGITLEKHTTIGKALSAPLATMALALIIANLGIIPFESSIYSMTNRYLIPLAVPMLLFDSDLKRIISDTGTLLIAFGIGAMATIIGTIIAFPLLPLKSMGYDIGWRIACALAARHIGGAINFVAVAETLHIPASAISAAIAADNIVVALYFAFLFTMSKEGEDNDNDDITTKPITVVDPESVSSITEVENNNATTTTTTSSNITISTLAIAIAVASTLVACGRFITQLLLPKGTSSLPIVSLLTVMAATIRPKFFTTIRSSGTALGIIFIQMFFAASGAAGSLRLVLQQAPSLFLFSTLQITIHYISLIIIGRGIFRLPIKELYLASNANVGGPTTAAAMAQAKQWKRLVLPALLIGILGYATATAIALSLGPILLRLPTL